MSKAKLDYFTDALWDSLDRLGVTLTSEQVAGLAEDMVNAVEYMDMAFPAPESPYPREIAELEAKLRREENSESCPECKGRGETFMYYGWGRISSTCWKCSGHGKVYPS